MKCIGVIGGLGWESSAVYYRVMNRLVRERCGGMHSCRMILDSLDFEPFGTAQRRADFDKLRDALVASATRLERAGAELVLIACNTVHRFAPAVSDAISVPFLHIADPLGQALKRDGHHKVGLLGTRATMESAFYRKYLAHCYGLEVIVPSRPERDALNSLILDELQAGLDPTLCAPRLDQLLSTLATQGATAVALSCTELGLIYGASDSPVIQRVLPAYDSAILHAHQAVTWALTPGI